MGRVDTVRTRAARASCLPAIRPAREVHRCDRTGGACGYVRSLMPSFGEPGPTLSLRDESPAGENRGGTPAGERARKRRAAQAAFLRGAYSTPLACGHETPASAGVPLPFLFSFVIASFVVVIASDSEAIQLQPKKLDFFVASAPRNDEVGKTRARKTRRQKGWS